MAESAITILLDPQTAQAYESAAPEERRKIQALVSLRIRELTSGRQPSLAEVLDEAGQKAKATGLTQEILDSLLKGA